MIDQVDRYLTDNAPQFVEDLTELLRIPSISADSSRQSDVRRAAENVLQQMTSIGIDARIVETAGHPIVHGHWLKAPGAPTVMVYGHYDVQPPDPLDLWETPPFEPTVRGDAIYARGSSDDKGQMLTHIKSAQAWLKTAGKLPVNIHFVIEGEEEVGSNNLDKFLADNRDTLKCDVAVVSDTAQYAPGIPGITYGLRGILACEATLTGPHQDLHSGVFGGAIANPANQIARLIARLHDDEGRVQIPSFYDDVLPLSPEERRRYADLPFDRDKFLADMGVDADWGEAGYSIPERRSGRPTCEVNGLYSGYQGEGPKTIIPSKATVKITCRLVPNQDPQKLTANLEHFLRKHCPPGLKLQFTPWHGCAGLVFDTSGPWMQAASRAIATAFGREPVFIREGGSIPVVSTFREILGVDTLLLGWGQNSDNLHGPNEHFSLTDFHRGMRASAHLWQELALAKQN
ncbi:MAG: dipeptidase [Planctomycetaceae bacterium]|nr:dipeptidase [Planctomycetaceae bacterium]